MKKRYILIILIVASLPIFIFSILIPDYSKSVKKTDIKTNTSTTPSLVVKESQSIEKSYAPPVILAQSIDLKIPQYKQRYALSCEAASTYAALKFLGAKFSEDDILSKLPFDKTTRTYDDSGKIIWGNPYKAYVGDYRGIFHKTGYGVYSPPIADVIKVFGYKSIDMQNASIDNLFQEVNLNHPVIVWVPTNFEVQEVKYWYTEDGAKIPFIDHEHAMVFKGYNMEKSEIYLMDVNTGTNKTVSLSDFVRGWGYLSNMAVSISK